MGEVIQQMHLAAISVVAQSPGDPGSQPDLVPVILWTLAIILVALLAASLGYLYRRARGAPDELIPRNVDPYYAVEGHVDTHATGEIHPEMAHDDVGMDAAHEGHAGDQHETAGTGSSAAH